MKEALSVQELKVICEFFYNEGYKRNECLRGSPAGRKERGIKWAENFEATFDNLMLGKYNKMIEGEALTMKWEEMQSEIQKAMDKWDEDQRGKAGKVIEDMRKLFFQ